MVVHIFTYGCDVYSWYILIRRVVMTSILAFIYFAPVSLGWSTLLPHAVIIRITITLSIVGAMCAVLPFTSKCVCAQARAYVCVCGNSVFKSMYLYLKYVCVRVCAKCDCVVRSFLPTILFRVQSHCKCFLQQPWAY